MRGILLLLSGLALALLLTGLPGCILVKDGKSGKKVCQSEEDRKARDKAARPEEENARLKERIARLGTNPFRMSQII